MAKAFFLESFHGLNMQGHEGLTASLTKIPLTTFGGILTFSFGCF